MAESDESRITPHIIACRCPNCAGIVSYDPESDRTICSHCGCEFSPSEELWLDDSSAGEAYASHEAPLKSETPSEFVERASWNEPDASSRYAKKYACPACGAVLIADVSSVSLSCPYCNNNLLVHDIVTDADRPDAIVPFSVSKEDAAESIRVFVKMQSYLARDFPREPQEIYPLYVPYYAFDIEVEGKGEYTLFEEKGVGHSRLRDVYAQYEGELLKTTAIGDKGEESITCAGKAEVGNIVMDASAKMPDTYMRALSPFPFEKAEPFSSARIAGIYAESADEGKASCLERAGEEAGNELNGKLTLHAIANSGKTYVSADRDFEYGITGHKEKLFFVPVWAAPVEWHGNTYLFAVNGTSGKCVSDLPLSKKKRNLCILAIVAVCALLVVSLFLSKPGHVYGPPTEALVAIMIILGMFIGLPLLCMLVGGIHFFLSESKSNLSNLSSYGNENMEVTEFAVTQEAERHLKKH